MAWTGRERGFCPPGQAGPVRRGAQHEATVAVAVERGRGDGGRCVAASPGQRCEWPGRRGWPGPPRSPGPGRQIRPARTVPAATRPVPAPTRRPGIGQEDPRPGMTGADVKKVQKRLRALKYYPGRVDGGFGPSTVEAVWAFKEVQGLRTRKLTPTTSAPAMERRLAQPRAPRPVSVHHQNNRIDISLRHEYLVLYRHGKVKLISHVSTGGGYIYPCPGGGGTAVTRDHPDRELQDAVVHARMGAGAARRDVQPDVLHRARPMRFTVTPTCRGACIARLRADPDGHCQVLPRTGQDPGHPGLHPP